MCPSGSAAHASCPRIAGGADRLRQRGGEPARAPPPLRPCESLPLTHCRALCIRPVPVRSAVQLGSDLTLMMLIEVDPARSAALHSALAEHARKLRDVHLITRISEPAAAWADVPGGGVAGSVAPPAPQRTAKFHMAALDRPGLVHTVTSAWRVRDPGAVRARVQRAGPLTRLRRCLRAEFLAAHGLEVVDMKCEQRDAFVDGRPCVPRARAPPLLLPCAQCARAGPSR
jgi:hypothetical protein